MKVNSKIRYGLRTLIEIAKSQDGVLQKDISINQNISNKYLDSIISSLKVKGLISNIKGKGSGYKLTRSADMITMFDIYTAFEVIEVVECLTNSTFCDKANNGCESRCYWGGLKKDFDDLLKKRSLTEIIKLSE